MSAFVKASVPADQFALAETFDQVPGVEFDAVRLVTHGSDRVVPLLWATNAETDIVADALASDSTVSSVELVSERNHDSLFRVAWTARVRFLTELLVAEGGAVVSARGTNDAWSFWILFPEREAVSSTYDACEEYDVRIDRIQSLEDCPSLGGVHLTDAQFRTVKAALEKGYYEVPRQITLEELAVELDVSHQALSERLRRGHRTLVETIIGP
jgi:predicted DNA binding protein